MNKYTLVLTLFSTACVSMQSDEKLATRYCETEIECGPELTDGAFWVEGEKDACVDGRLNSLDDADSEDCYTEARALLECKAKISSCEELDAYWEEPTTDYPCHEEEDLYSECYTMPDI